LLIEYQVLKIINKCLPYKKDPKIVSKIPITKLFSLFIFFEKPATAAAIEYEKVNIVKKKTDKDPDSKY
jgi:hypothetical protein